MKNRHFFLFVFLVLLLFSCSSNIEDESLDKDLLYISLDSSSRTILPSSIDFSSTDYHFYIWGISSKNENISPRKVSFLSSSSTTGTIPIDFPVMSYNFYLAATESELSDFSTGSKILEKAIALGCTNADLSYSKNVKFYLSSDSISGFGGIKLSLSLDSSWSSDELDELVSDSYTITAGLYNISSGDELEDYTPHLLSVSGNLLGDYSLSRVPKGDYDFIVKFTKRGSSVSYSFSERIKIFANQNIDSSLSIPNVLVRAPEAPSDFKASYIDLKTDSNLTTTPYVVTENSYLLLLSWSDNSNNEDYFKITLVDVSKMADFPNIPQNMTDNDWLLITNHFEGNSNVVKIFDDKYNTRDEYIAGSVDRNSTALVLSVPLGACYIAKIESVNEAGISKACYVSLDEDFNVQVPDKNYVGGRIYKGKAFYSAASTGQAANRYRIAYHLNGGTISYTENGSSVTKTEDFSEYHTIGETVQIIQPDSGSLDGKQWKTWRKNSVSGSVFSATNYAGCNSIYLFANYE